MVSYNNSIRVDANDLVVSLLGSLNNWIGMYLYIPVNKLEYINHTFCM